MSRIARNPFNFICSVLSCEKAILSSLHGLIIADAYGTPSIWAKFSEKIIGNNIKFHDYYQSVGCEVIVPVSLSDLENINDFDRRFERARVQIDIEKLIAACPLNCININIRHCTHA